MVQWGTPILGSEPPVFFAFLAITSALVNICAPNVQGILTKILRKYEAKILIL